MKRIARIATTIVILIALFPVYWKLGKFSEQIYVEIKFDQVRWGDLKTMAEVDSVLSWFDRDEIAEGLIPPYLLRGPDIEPIIEGKQVQYISYYMSGHGFVVVYDMQGTKIGQLKSNI